MVWIEKVHHDALHGRMFGTNTGCCWPYLPSHVLPLLVHIDEESKKASKLHIGIMQ